LKNRSLKTRKGTPLVFKESLIVQNLNFGYDINKPLFLNFSATIPANKITGIVGKSWRKTTLIDIIAGLQK
jgi:ABC-type cobalamin/Fe3+-siderophores transport system ATPase subunit